nr:cas scaffolding protein family member 4 [Misgurnus anguillicaudatus]
METLFAKALFDNTAESEDELAFRKGDIIVVLERNVVGSIGWWKCSLRGRQGLAPANRLGILSPADAESLCANLSVERDSLLKQNCQNIYQIPKNMPSPPDPIYEDMNMISNRPLPCIPSADKRMSQDDPGGNSPLRDVAMTPSRTGAELYDVPSLLRRTSMITPPAPQPPMQRKVSLMPTTEIQKRYETLRGNRSVNASNKNVCIIRPLVSQDPSYEVPMPCISEDSPKPPFVCSTMSKISKSDWIYDVPVFMQKQGAEPDRYGTMPSKTISSDIPLYDTLPARVCPERKAAHLQPVYDIPKPSLFVQADSCTYDVPPFLKPKETSEHSTLPRQYSAPEIDSIKNHEPLDYRGTSRPICDQLLRLPLRGRTLSRQATEGGIRRDYGDNKDNQRSSTVSDCSTASSSSRSSCDSFLLSSPEPEPLREVTLSQEEAGQRLHELRDAVCQSVPKLMLFVSSQWRSKEHLGQHLQQIRTATEEVTDSITSFLNFALDVRGNAQRLTDSNLQARLLKQLSIVEDSGLILQQAANLLRGMGWRLDVLAQDDGKSQTHDHLEQFVMVARTVPEDVTRLVSILNANGKLLFKVPAKEQDMAEQSGSSEKRLSKSEPTVDSGIDDSDYIQLQTNTEEVVQQPKLSKSSFKQKKNGDTIKKQVTKSLSLSPCRPLQTSKKPSISDHCRLYFGAIQKAISVFISSLNDGHPPEKFISHSKLVIMVGQRLVNSLCTEAKNTEASQEMLSMSNQLCAHLKQLAVITKKAALNYPDQQTLQEAQNIAKELAQRAQHFRMSLDA